MKYSNANTLKKKKTLGEKKGYYEIAMKLMNACSSEHRNSLKCMQVWSPARKSMSLHVKLYSS